MSFAFGPNGFDEDRKERAREAEELLTYATAGFGIAATVAAVAMPPLALGFGVAWAVGPLLIAPLAKIRRDPPREDFFRASEVAERFDPAGICEGLPREFVEDRDVTSAISALSAYISALARAGGHTRTMVTAVERAMGAHIARSDAGIELQIAEARYHAERALPAAVGVAAAASELSDRVETLVGEAAAYGVELTPQALLRSVDFDRLAEGEAIMELIGGRVSAGSPFEGFESYTLVDSSRAVISFFQSLLDDAPRTAQEFISASDESRAR